MYVVTGDDILDAMLNGTDAEFAGVLENYWHELAVEMKDNEYLRKRELFDQVSNPENWKLPTRPVEFDTLDEADEMLSAITHFVGGAEMLGLPSGKIAVWSKGYYHHIGA